MSNIHKIYKSRYLPMYISSKLSRIQCFGKAYGTKVRCNLEHVGGSGIENMRSMWRTNWEFGKGTHWEEQNPTSLPLFFPPPPPPKNKSLGPLSA